MKRTRRFSVIALFSIILLLSGCTLFSDNGTLSGTVTDTLSESGVNGALVTVGGETTKTGTDGKFTMELKAGTYDIKIEKAGYAQHTGTVTIEKGNATTHDVALVPVGQGTLAGQITDKDTTSPLTGAVVTIGDQTVSTDENGNYSIKVTAGQYNVTIGKLGYTAIEDTATILNDETTTLDATLEVAPTTYVNGIVTDGRGGPVVEGVTITVAGLADYTTTTDANGEFRAPVPAGQPVDLLVEAENRATMRVQAVELAQDEEIFVEVPTRDIFNPNWSAVPPTISLNIEPGQELTGTQDLTVNVTGERSTYLIYAYLGGNHRNPRTMFESDTDTATVPVDTTAYPNGETFLKVLVYDDNENGALYIIPVTINNVADDTVLPGDITVLKVISQTYGQNIGFYNVNKLNDHFNDANVTDALQNAITAAPAGASSSVSVLWDPVENADGYAIYRAFATIDEATGDATFTDYKLLSRVPASATSIADYSSQINASQPMMYKVVPYNSFGEGNSMARVVMPLPAFNVYLETPANDSTNVPLQPSFTWSNDVVDGPMMDGVSFTSTLSIYEGTGSMVWADDEVAGSTYDLPISLEPNTHYTWDISYSEAFALYEYDGDFGYSYAVSVAGELNENGGSGSINGEYLFTTIPNVQ